jgi:hypothetical protein
MRLRVPARWSIGNHVHAESLTPPLDRSQLARSGEATVRSDKRSLKNPPLKGEGMKFMNPAAARGSVESIIGLVGDGEYQFMEVVAGA